MVVCPNCGSWNMTSAGDPTYPTTSHLQEVWRCDCGCTVRRTMKTVNEEIRYPDGKTVKRTVK